MAVSIVEMVQPSISSACLSHRSDWLAHSHDSFGWTKYNTERDQVPSMSELKQEYLSSVFNRVSLERSFLKVIVVPSEPALANFEKSSNWEWRSGLFHSSTRPLAGVGVLLLESLSGLWHPWRLRLPLGWPREPDYNKYDVMTFAHILSFVPWSLQNFGSGLNLKPWPGSGDLSALCGLSCGLSWDLS